MCAKNESMSFAPFIQLQLFVQRSLAHTENQNKSQVFYLRDGEIDRVRERLGPASLLDRDEEIRCEHNTMIAIASVRDRLGPCSLSNM